MAFTDILHVILCSIMIIACGAFSINVTGYYEIDQETKLIRAIFFFIAIGLAIIIGTII